MATSLRDRGLAVGYGLVGAAGLLIPLLVGLAVGQPAQGGVVALGAFLVTIRANPDPPGVRLGFMLAGVLVLAAGSVAGVLLAANDLLLIPVATVAAALAIRFPVVGFTAPLALLLTAANPLPVDPVPHLVLQVAGGLLAAFLLTLPWAWRRTRPLAATLKETAGSLADLFEATFDDDRWEDLRGEVADALQKARTACARHRWERRSRDAERITTALRRVFYEAVTLRELAEAAGRREEIEPLTTELAARTRALFHDDVEIAEVDFAARIDELRGDRPDDERELLRLVLLRQIDHAATRIRATLDQARTPSMRLKSVLIPIPRLPAQSPVTDAVMIVPRSRSMRMTRDDPGFRHLLRATLGTAMACVIIAIFTPEHAQWLALGVLLTIQPTFGETLDKAGARVGGSIAGALIAAVVLLIAPGYGWLAALIVVSAGLGFGLYAVHYAYWATFMTMCVLLLIDIQAMQTWEIAGFRIGLNVLGGAIALACVRLLWPRGEAVRLRNRLAGLLKAHAVAVRTLAETTRGRRPEGAAELAIRKAADEAERVESAIAAMVHEPGAGETGHIADLLEEVTRVRDGLITLTSVLREDPGNDVGPAPAVLHAVADRLERGAEAVKENGPYEPQGDVDQKLSDLRMWLGQLALRRLDELDTDPADSRTEVRRALLHAAAADHALKALADDSARVVSLATGDP
ncbi:FUSC family protein [Herbidospora mongoliensis]|uniref:FUSC family protein n=1 Tax=Herbidospora mongoliensis TaxID=688067 RepID=UPI00082AAFAE|nr:FUSC family protein [Herbidospora mongoliensis]